MYQTKEKGFSSDDSDKAVDCPIECALEALYHVTGTVTSRSLGHAVGLFLSKKLDKQGGVDCWMSDEAYAQLKSTASSQWSAREFLDSAIAGHLEETSDHASDYCHICSDISSMRRSFNTSPTGSRPMRRSLQ